jgi:hypothetical protein
MSQFDLFADPNADQLCETPAPQRPQYTAAWRRYIALVEQLKPFDIERAAIHGSLDLGKPFSAPCATTLLCESRSSLNAALKQLAMERFAPPSGAFEHEESRYERLLPENYRKGARDPIPHAEWDPDLIWSALEATYSGQAGQDLVLTRLAENLVEELGLRYNPPIHKSNRLVIERTISTDSFGTKGKTLSFNSAQSVRAILKGFYGFAVWADDPDTTRPLAKLMRDEFSYCSAIESRARFTAGSIEITTFNNKFVYELFGDLATKFQEFIAIYGAEALQR